MSRAGKDTENILFCKDLEVLKLAEILLPVSTIQLLTAKAQAQQKESPGPRMEDAASQCDANGGESILSSQRGEPSDKRREGLKALREGGGGRVTSLPLPAPRSRPRWISPG